MACGWPRGSLGGSPGRYFARSAENSGFEICRILPCPQTCFHERIRCRLDSAPTKQFAALHAARPSRNRSQTGFNAETPRARSNAEEQSILFLLSLRSYANLCVSALILRLDSLELPAYFARGLR